MFETVAEIIAKQLNKEIDSITPDKSIMDDLGADSLDVVEMLMALETSLGVNVPDEDIPSLKTVGDVVQYVESNT